MPTTVVSTNASEKIHNQMFLVPEPWGWTWASLWLLGLPVLFIKEQKQINKKFRRYFLDFKALRNIIFWSFQCRQIINRQSTFCLIDTKVYAFGKTHLGVLNPTSLKINITNQWTPNDLDPIRPFSLSSPDSQYGWGFLSPGIILPHKCQRLPLECYWRSRALCSQ